MKKLTVFSQLPNIKGNQLIISSKINPKYKNIDQTILIPINKSNYVIRWYNNNNEIELCGHGLMGAAYMILLTQASAIFYSKNHKHYAIKKALNVYVSLPYFNLHPMPTPDIFKNALQVDIIQAYFSKNNTVWVLELANEQSLLKTVPDINLLLTLPKEQSGALIITAKSQNYDFCYRYFTPWYGKNEDSATGSAQSLLTPFWAERLGKTCLSAIQLSETKGLLFTELWDGKVWINGEVTIYE